jgi:hypothetical protein
MAASCAGSRPSALRSIPAIHTPGPEANECRPARAANLTLERGIAGHVDHFCNGNDQYRVNVGRKDGKPVMSVVAAYALAVSRVRYEMVISGVSRGRTKLPFTARVRPSAAEDAATSGSVILYQLTAAQAVWKTQSGTVTFGASGIELDVQLRNGERSARLVGRWSAEPDVQRH